MSETDTSKIDDSQVYDFYLRIPFIPESASQVSSDILQLKTPCLNQRVQVIFGQNFELILPNFDRSEFQLEFLPFWDKFRLKSWPKWICIEFLAKIFGQFWWFSAKILGRFSFNGIISATGFSGLRPDMDKRFFASCSWLLLVSRKNNDFSRKWSMTSSPYPVHVNLKFSTFSK